MKISLFRIVKIELIKFFKRADLITVLGLVVISLFYAINMDQSTGQAENQSAVYWVANQLMLITALFIGPVIMAYIATQFLGVEIENGSIMLFEEKIRNRKRLYLGKNIAMTITCTLLFIICAGIMFFFYFNLLDSNLVFVSGELFGNYTKEIVLYILCIYAYTFFFVPQVSFFLGTKYKPLSAIVITVGIVLLCNYVFNFAPLKYINPFWNVMNLTDQILTETGTIKISTSELNNYAALQLFLTIGYYFIFTFVGSNVFSKKDIQ